MTPEQIDAMEAGAEIDELAARTVMGWCVHQRNTAWWVKQIDHKAIVHHIQGIVGDFSPSTNIADTQRLWDELKRRKLEVNMNYENEWIVSIVSGKFGLIGAHAPTLELAMTKAACKAAGKET